MAGGFATPLTIGLLHRIGAGPVVVPPDDSSNAWDRVQRQRSTRSISFRVSEVGEDRARFRLVIEGFRFRVQEQGADTAKFSLDVIPHSTLRFRVPDAGQDCACFLLDVAWPPPVPGDIDSILLDMDRELASSRVVEDGRDRASFQLGVQWLATEINSDLLREFLEGREPVVEAPKPKPAPKAEPKKLPPSLDPELLAAIIPDIDHELASSRVVERGRDTARFRMDVGWTVSSEAAEALMELMDD